MARQNGILGFPPVSWIYYNIVELFWSYGIACLIYKNSQLLLDTLLIEEIFPALAGVPELSSFLNVVYKFWAFSSILVFFAELTRHWVWDFIALSSSKLPKSATRIVI